MPRVLIPVADYGSEPTEVAIPWTVFEEAGFEVTFATEKGATPKCDSKMLYGATGTLLGANAAAKKVYAELEKQEAFQRPVAWSDPNFSLDTYDIVYLPGGHDKGVKQLIEAEILQKHLQSYFPQTLRSGHGKKTLAALCHGVQVLAFTPSPDSPAPAVPLKDGKIEADKPYKSIIHACKTTALPGFMESIIYQTTRVALGDYYKTYGAGTPNVEDYVKLGLDDAKQFDAGPSWYNPSLAKPYIVEDDGYRYLSARFPPDAEMIAKRAVQLAREVLGIKA